MRLTVHCTVVDFQCIPEFFCLEDIKTQTRQFGVRDSMVIPEFINQCNWVIRIGRDSFINLARLEADYEKRN